MPDPVPLDDRSDYWPCACVRRKNGVMSQIKMNHRDRKRCRTCGCERPYWFDDDQSVEDTGGDE